jgi:hypothetical protein
MEVWLPIGGYEGLYEVSDLGRVRSLDRIVEHRNGNLHLKGRVLKPADKGDGHLRLVLCRHGQGQIKAVHRLVLMAFIGPAGINQATRHLDGDAKNNILTNLQWGTQRENLLDAVRHGTHAMSKKTHCSRGHEYAGPNLKITIRGRYCLACHSARGKVTYRKTGDVTQIADALYLQIMKVGNSA